MSDFHGPVFPTPEKWCIIRKWNDEYEDSVFFVVSESNWNKETDELIAGWYKTEEEAYNYFFGQFMLDYTEMLNKLEA